MKWLVYLAAIIIALAMVLSAVAGLLKVLDPEPAGASMRTDITSTPPPTIGAWADELTQYMGGTPNPVSRALIVAWSQKEGCMLASNQCIWNPLATTKNHPRQTGDHNGVGVKHYADWEAGIEAEAWTLAIPYFQPIRDNLLAGNVEGFFNQPGWAPYSCGWPHKKPSCAASGRGYAQAIRVIFQRITTTPDAQAQAEAVQFPWYQPPPATVQAPSQPITATLGIPGTEAAMLTKGKDMTFIGIITLSALAGALWYGLKTKRLLLTYTVCCAGLIADGVMSWSTDQYRADLATASIPTAPTIQTSIGLALGIIIGGIAIAKAGHLSEYVTTLTKALSVGALTVGRNLDKVVAIIAMFMVMSALAAEHYSLQAGAIGTACVMAYVLGNNGGKLNLSAMTKLKGN